LKGAVEEELWMDLQDFEKRNYIMAIGYYSDPSGIN